MQEQWPTKKLSLFRAFNGYAEHFYLTNSAKTLSPFYAINFRNDTNALINMYFTEENMKGDTFTNNGKMGGSMKLEGRKQFENIYFKVPSEGGNVDGTLSDKRKIFDGIACNDKHITTQLSSASSYISFNTPTLKEWSRENSVEFWFKVTDPAAYSQD